MKYLRVQFAVFFAALIFSTAASAELHDRGGGLIYDDVLDITWLQNVTLAAGSIYDDDYPNPPAPNPNTDGLLSYLNAVAWVESLEYYDSVRGVVWSDWRLPRIRPINGSSFNLDPAYDGSTDVGYNITSQMHELSYMYYVNLKNKGQFDTTGVQQTGYGFVNDPGDPKDESLFINLRPGTYWYGQHRPFGFNPNNVFDFRARYGNDSASDSRYIRYAWAVRDGDVAALPPLVINSISAEPASILDTQTSQLSASAVDPQPGPQALSYQWSVVSGGGTLSNAGTTNPTYTPANVTGSQAVVVRVSVTDGASTAKRDLALQVNDANAPPPNVAPQITVVSATPSTIWDSQQSQLSVTATDADGPSGLTYQWAVVSGGGMLDSATSPTPWYAPADVIGTQTVTLRVTVSDGAASASRDLTLAVQDANPPPPGTQLLGQDFTAGSFAGWSYVDEGTISAPSKWRMVSGELVQQSNIRDETLANDLPKLGTYLLYGDGLGWTSYKVRFRLRSTDDDTLGVMFRYIDPDNWYRFSWDSQLKQRRLVKKAGGVYSLLAADNVPYEMGRNYQVQVVAQGSQLEVWIDGVRIFQVTDAALNRGSIAFYTWQNNAAYFDNLVVEDLSGGNFNTLPKITALTATPATILDNQTSQLAVTATDTDGPSALSYKWTVVSGGGVINAPTNANPMYIPVDVVGAQTVKLKVEISDGAATVAGNLTLTVNDANPPPLGPLLLSGDFSGTLAGWSTHDEGTISAPSKWRIVSGELAQQSNIRDGSATNDLPKLGSYLLYDGGTAWTNYRAKFKLRSTDNDTLGLMFRVIDPNNWYRFSWDNQLNQRRLVKKVAGVYTLLAADNVPYVVGQTYDMEVIANGSQLEVWVDGVRIFQITDAALNRGSVGFYTWQNNAAFFDDLQINAIE